jgi:hypothetical protein
VVAFGAGVSLVWNALPEVQLQVADELAGGGTQWRSLTDQAEVEQFGGVAQVTLPAVQSQRFFRLVLP